jgi:hypothetical protein
LWSLLVCEGGLFIKVVPFLEVVFTSKTLKDFGYLGYPYELGLFEGWVVNVVALGLTHITIASVTIFLHRHQAHRALDFLGRRFVHAVAKWRGDVGKADGAVSATERPECLESTVRKFLE